MTTQRETAAGSGRTKNRRRVRSAEYKARRALKEKERRADRKARGLCKTCPVVVTIGRTHCDECLAGQRAYKAERAKRLLDELLQASQAPISPPLTVESLDDEGNSTSADHMLPFENKNESAYNNTQESGTAEPDRSTVPSPAESCGLQWPGCSVDQPILAIKPACSVACSRDEADQCLLSDAPANACWRQTFARLGGMVLMIVTPRYPTVAPWPGPDDGDEGRTERGWHIAACTPFVKVAGGWITPSQSDPSTHYRLAMDEDGSHCSCPDQVAVCKHIRGLEFVLERERQTEEMVDSLPAAQSIRDPGPQGRNQKPLHSEGNGDVSDAAGTQTMDLDAPIREVRERSRRGPDSPARKRIAPGTEGRKRPTFQQDWPVYNAAQRNEKYHFRHLLRDLVALVEEPVHQRGRRPHSYATQIFGLVYQQYVGKSLRKFDTDLREAFHNDFVDAAPSTSTLARYMDDQALTPVLHDLVLCSALPMKGYESKFAIDATGFSTDRFARWFSEKWGKVKEHQARDWAKLHLVCGTETQIITCAEVSDWRDHDSRLFAPLVAGTAESFDVHRVAADKAYTSRGNYAQVDGLGATLYAPFKSNVVPPTATDDSAWARMLRRFLTDYDRWAEDYHVRSNVESAISKMKRLFGDELRFRNVVAQSNELLCRVIAHNLVVLIYQMYERNLVTEFHGPELMTAA